MPSAHPVPLETLIAYCLGELSPAQEATVEEHYFACEKCTSRLQGVQLLGEGIAMAARAGRVSASVTSQVVTHATEQGLKVRNYRVAPRRSVACTAAPEDDFIAIHLELQAADVQGIDVSVDWTDLDSGASQARDLTDVTFDRDANEVVLLFSGADIRDLPRSRWEMELAVRTPGGTRRVGPYTLQHTPWEQLGR